MGAGESFCAVDDETVDWVCGDGSVLWILDVEVVGVAHGAVLDNGDADAACDEIFRKPFSFTCFLSSSEGSLRNMTHCSSIG